MNVDSFNLIRHLIHKEIGRLAALAKEYEKDAEWAMYNESLMNMLKAENDFLNLYVKDKEA